MILVVLPDGSISVEASGKERDIADLFDNLPDSFKVGGLGDIDRVSRERFGRFDLAIRQPYFSEEPYPVVDTKSVNEVIKGVAEEFDLVPTYVEPVQTEDAQTLLTTGSVASQDGKVGVSFRISTGGFLDLVHADGTPGAGFLYNQTYISNPSERSDYFVPTFVDAGEGKYLYVPQISQERLDQGVKPSKIELGLEISGGINTPLGRRVTDPRYDSVPDMWNPQSVALMKKVEARVKEQFVGG